MERDSSTDPVGMDVCPSTVSQDVPPDEKENSTEKNEEMSTTPTVATAPVAPVVDDTEFMFTFMLQHYNTIEKQKVYSQWEFFAGFQWRLLIFPRGNQTKHELSVYLECGGPIIPEASDKRSVSDTAMDHTLPRHAASSLGWTRAAHFWLHLVHPCKWPSLGIPDQNGPETKTGTTAPQGSVAPSGRVGYENAQSAVLESTQHRAHPTQDIVKDTIHAFKERESDWGFCEFAPFSMLRPGKYADDQFNVLIKVRIRLEDSYADAIPHNNITYDSRKETGYVGFKNQGATCYMNSLLQTLYMLSAFRRAVYDMPLPDQSAENSDSDMSYALQKVFYELQYSASVVKTKKLTESFGWESTDSFTQHDVQELNRILCDHLEEKMKKMNMEGPNTISELFQGKFLNYIQCINVDYKSTREESFYDLSLNVKGCRNIMDSFQKYTEVEMMDGDNKYRADGFEELQEARKGATFLQLPPVLQLHLKRFEYDYARDSLVKINDRYEFGTEIDLSNFVENSDGSDVYLLHSVLVHIGDVNGGHYHAFIRPHLEKGPDQDPDKWLKFDDEAVMIVNEREAVNDNFGFGGERELMTMNNGVKRGKLDMDDDISNMGVNGQLHPPGLTPTRKNHQSRKFTNAYMLQYLRKSKVSTLLKPCTDADIPTELAERINREQQLDEQRRKDRAEQHLYMVIAIATDRDLSRHFGADLVDWEKVHTMRVRRALKLKDLKLKLQKDGHCQDASQVRLWKCNRRHNDTIRPEGLVSEGDDDRPMSEGGPRDLMNTNSYNLAMYNTRYDQYTEDTFKIFIEDFRSSRCYSAGANVTEARMREKEAEKAAANATPTPTTVKELSPAVKTENGVTDAKTMDADDAEATAPTTDMQDEVMPNPRLHSMCEFPLKNDEILLFFKLYIPDGRPTLHWLGHAVVNKSMNVAELLECLGQELSAAGVRNPEALVVYEELSVGSVAQLNPTHSLKWLNVNGGDIIVFQPPLSPDISSKISITKVGNDTFSQDGLLNWDFVQTPVKDGEKEFPLGGRPLPTVRDYYSYLANHIKIEFKNKRSFNEGDEPAGIYLELLKRDSYLTVRKILANILQDGADADYLRLYPHDSQRQGPAHDPVKMADNDELLKIPPVHMHSAHLISSHISRMDYRILWYERTEYPLSEIDEKEEIRVVWHGDGGTKASAPLALSKPSTNGPLGMRDTNDASTTSEDISVDETGTDTTVMEKELESPATVPASTASVTAEDTKVSFSVLVQPMSKFEDVIHEIKRRQRIDSMVPVRLLEVKNFRICRLIDPGEPVPHMIASYDYATELRAEPVPADETPEALGEEYQLVPVVHMAKERHRGARLTFFGVPFVLPVKCSGQTVQELRELIRTKLAVTEQEFSSWKLAEVIHHKVEYLDDVTYMWNAGSRSNSMDYSTLAIEHRSPTPARRMNTGGRFADKPLKIRG